MVSGIVHDNANTCNEEQKLRWGGNSQDKENSRGVGGGVKASAGGNR